MTREQALSGTEFPLLCDHIYPLNPSIHYTTFLSSDREMSSDSRYVIARDVQILYSEIDPHAKSLFGLHRFLRSSPLLHSFHNQNAAPCSCDDGYIECWNAVSKKGLTAVIAVRPGSQASGKVSENIDGTFTSYEVVDAAIVPSLRTIFAIAEDSGPNDFFLNTTNISAARRPFEYGSHCTATIAMTKDIIRFQLRNAIVFN